MRRFTTLIGALALIVGACTGSATTPSPASPSPSPSPSASPAVASPAPSPSPAAVQARVTFDGKTCVYEGPLAVPNETQVEFTFAPTYPAAVSMLYVGPVAPGTTWDEILKYPTDNSSQNEPPKWLVGSGLQQFGPGSTTTALRDYDFVVICFTPKSDTDKAVPGALIHVVGA